MIMLTGKGGYRGVLALTAASIYSLERITAAQRILQTVHISVLTWHCWVTWSNGVIAAPMSVVGSLRDARRDARHSRKAKLAQVVWIKVTFCRKVGKIGRRGTEWTCRHARDVPSKDKKELVYSGKLLRGAYVEGNGTGIESRRRKIAGG